MLPGVGFEPTTYRLQGGGANDGFRRVADALKIRWCGKAAEFALDHAGEGDRRAFLEKAPISCAPIGRPSGLLPIGKVVAGSPFRIAIVAHTI